MNKILSANFKRLLSLLNDSQFHTGRELGAILGVSRTAIWKIIEQMSTFGLVIARDKTRGYRLDAPLILLDEDSLYQHLSPKDFKLHILADTSSTNLFVKKLPVNPITAVCLSEQQQLGRGRFQRHWHSPFGQNIYCSSRWQFDSDLSQLSGLSLIVSLAIIKSLKDYGLKKTLSIKWPNDLYHEDKKLCGSLIELSVESNARTEVIIGIGLNVNMTHETDNPIDKPWCSLKEIWPTNHNRNHLAALMLNALKEYLKTPCLAKRKLEWDEHDYLYGKSITINNQQGGLQGTACGIDEQGHLLLKDRSGIMHAIASGDASIQL